MHSFWKKGSAGCKPLEFAMACAVVRWMSKLSHATAIDNDKFLFPTVT